MATEYKHYQQWDLRITPDEGEQWPRAFSRMGDEFQPTSIGLYARTGTTPSVYLRGSRIKADGKPGARQVSSGLLPAWASVKLAAECERLGLNEDYFREQGAVRQARSGDSD